MYVIEEVASFQVYGQVMGVAHNRTCVRALQTSRKKATVTCMYMYMYM